MFLIFIGANAGVASLKVGGTTHYQRLGDWARNFGLSIDVISENLTDERMEKIILKMSNIANYTVG